MPKPAAPRANRRPRTRPPPPVDTATEYLAAPLSLMAPDEAPGPHDQLDALLLQFGGSDSLTVNIERKKGSRGTVGHLGTVEFDGELFDRVKDLFGGGEYRGRVNVNGVFRRNINFAIAGPPREVKEPDGTAEPSGLQRLETLLAGVMEGVRELARMQATPPQGSRMTELKEMAETLRALQPPPAPASTTDPLAMMNSLLEFQARLEERAPARGGADWGPLAQVGSGLVGVLEKQVDLNRESMLRRRAPVPALPAASAPAGPLTGLAQVAARVPAMARGYLARCAAQDDDPDFNAELVLRQLPADVVAELPALLAADDAAAQLVAAVPEWAPYPAWFGELVDCLRLSLAPENDEVSEARDLGGRVLDARPD